MKKITAKIEFEIDLVALYETDDLPEFICSKGLDWNYYPNDDIWGYKEYNEDCYLNPIHHIQLDVREIDILDAQLKNWLEKQIYSRNDDTTLTFYYE